MPDAQRSFSKTFGITTCIIFRITSDHPEKMREKTATFRISEQDELNLLKLQSHLPLASRSALMRGLIFREAALWRKSPYVIEKAKHFVFVDNIGRFYYFPWENLKANRDLAEVTCSMRTKFDKVLDSSQTLDDILTLSRFFLYPPDGGIMSGRMNPPGDSRKVDRFSTEILKGEHFERCGCFVLNDYAQYSSKTESKADRLYDHCDFFTDIPTKKIEIAVVISSDFMHPRRTAGLFGQLINTDESHYSESLKTLSSDIFPVTADGARNPITVSPYSPLFWGKECEDDSDNTGGLSRAYHFVHRRFELFSLLCKENGIALTPPDSYFLYYVQATIPPLGLGISVSWKRP